MMAPPARRILITADAVGGVWTYATELSRGLCKRGDEVTLVVLGPAPRRDQLAPLHAIHGLTIVPSDLPLEWMDPEGADVACAQDRRRNIVPPVRPDVIH